MDKYLLDNKIAYKYPYFGSDYCLKHLDIKYKNMVDIPKNSIPMPSYYSNSDWTVFALYIKRKTKDKRTRMC